MIHRSQWKEVPDAPHGDFISEVLYRCIRLAYYERIERTIPRELVDKLPPKPIAYNKYTQVGPTVDGTKLYTESSYCAKMIRFRGLIIFRISSSPTTSHKNEE